ncbi:ribulose-phosphate 3-epimerase [Breznakiella homolactica]|uniref:Ribulose-phosphate 3-epimerase n=1 Tax=Breznakiella homolactica TaxID=2798577 RepID=A0A7T7XKM9_9SPIR|nr:ribulose-phosphate 3-epimerase [Breznakiella homolactica]QQO08175.1 ribulose-phosphate 3-epimerase [Breznakiella homolactica]
MDKPIIAPSVLSADFADMAAGLAEINNSGAEWVHLDVMDAKFVPNLTFGPKMVADIRPHSKLIFDAHLMTYEPENLAELFAEAGADYITFHIEATVHSHRLIQKIHSLGKKAGISIVPSTPVSYIEELLPFADLVLVMTVNPGYGGQQMIPQCLDKAERLVKLREERNYSYLVSVDGGLNAETAHLAHKAGVDVIVAGAAFFGAPDKAAMVKKLKGA